MPITDEQLICHLRAEFDSANSLKLWLFILAFLISIPAVLSILTSDNNVLYWLAIINFFLLLVWWLVNSSYQKARSASLAARRAAMLLNGLGGTLHRTTIADLNERFNVDLDKAPQMDATGYYCSTKNYSPERLAELTEESAFYSSRTHSYSADLMLGLVCVFLAIFAAVLFFALPTATNSSQIWLTRVFLAATVFFLSSDVLGRALAHRFAAQELKRIQRQCMMGADGHLGEVDILILLLDYISAMEGAPETVPLAFRGKQKEKIHKDWDIYLSTKQGSNPASEPK